MKYVIVILFFICTSAFTQSDTTFRTVYIESDGIESIIDTINGIEYVREPQLLIISFYTPNFKNHRFMLIGESLVAITPTEFYTYVARRCGEFKQAFGTGFCAIYHTAVPIHRRTILEFQRNTRDVMSRLFNCYQSNDCSIRYRSE